MRDSVELISNSGYNKAMWNILCVQRMLGAFQACNNFVSNKIVSNNVVTNKTITYLCIEYVKIGCIRRETHK